MDWSDKAEVYRGRKPRESPLWQLLDNHSDDFECRYDDLFSREFGFFRPVISHIVRNRPFNLAAICMTMSFSPFRIAKSAETISPQLPAVLGA